MGILKVNAGGNFPGWAQLTFDDVYFNQTDGLISLNAIPPTPIVENITAGTHTISDTDTSTLYICDTTGGDITFNLPVLANNYNKKVTIIHAVQGSNTTVTVYPEGGEDFTVDQLTNLELAKVGDRITVYASSQSDSWEILEERISCEFLVDTYLGYGTVDNKIMQFINVRQNYGNCFTENLTTGYNTGQAGLEILINKSGKYSFTFSAGGSISGNFYIGLSLNTSSQTVTIISIPVTDRLCLDSLETAVSDAGCCSINDIYLTKGDIIRPHTDGAAITLPDLCHFKVSYSGN